MKNGYKVEYSDDGNEVCIIPDRLIPFWDFDAIINAYIEMGYRWWLPTDYRCGYRLTKQPKENCPK